MTVTAKTIKDDARKQAKAVRASLGVQSGAMANAAAETGAPFILAMPAGSSVAGYWPIGDEFDPRPLLNTLSRRETPLALPVVHEGDGPLVFRHWDFGDPLIAGPYGTYHPEEAAPALVPDVILCPLLAFDMAGGRLGYGGGYYDRSFAALPGTRRIGVAYSAQMVNAVPTEPHDGVLDAVITETGVVLCGSKPLES